MCTPQCCASMAAATCMPFYSLTLPVQRSHMRIASPRVTRFVPVAGPWTFMPWLSQRCWHLLSLENESSRHLQRLIYMPHAGRELWYRASLAWQDVLGPDIPSSALVVAHNAVNQVASPSLTQMNTYQA